MQFIVIVPIMFLVAVAILAIMLVVSVISTVAEAISILAGVAFAAVSLIGGAALALLGTYRFGRAVYLKLWNRLLVTGYLLWIGAGVLAIAFGGAVLFSGRSDADGYTKWSESVKSVTQEQVLWVFKWEKEAIVQRPNVWKQSLDFALWFLAIASVATATEWIVKNRRTAAAVVRGGAEVAVKVAVLAKDGLDGPTSAKADLTIKKE